MRLFNSEHTWRRYISLDEWYDVLRNMPEKEGQVTAQLLNIEPTTVWR
ncbi:MAG: hypothetical protein J0M35_17440 [Candidatus Obscuribacter phosphatis]|uniref:Uncharacterized protein n=1 Tax=Candidatus Obscuribacter phosphatis TaxID=1906157 RepID=A0A8J7PEV4_9BACT|nr:hypothetical protein [Candidatus Obscuribacter phosphatis]